MDNFDSHAVKEFNTQTQQSCPSSPGFLRDCETGLNEIFSRVTGHDYGFKLFEPVPWGLHFSQFFSQFFHISYNISMHPVNVSLPKVVSKLKALNRSRCISWLFWNDIKHES